MVRSTNSCFLLFPRTSKLQDNYEGQKGYCLKLEDELHKVKDSHSRDHTVMNEKQTRERQSFLQERNDMAEKLNKVCP